MLKGWVQIFIIMKKMVYVQSNNRFYTKINEIILKLQHCNQIPLFENGQTKLF